MTTLCALMMLYPGFVHIHPEHVVHTSKTLHPNMIRMELYYLKIQMFGSLFLCGFSTPFYNLDKLDKCKFSLSLLIHQC